MSNPSLKNRINYEQVLLKLKLSLPKKSLSTLDKDKNIYQYQNSNLKYLSLNKKKISKAFLFENIQDNILTIDQPYKLQYKPKRLIKIQSHSINSSLKRAGSFSIDCKKLLAAPPLNLQIPIINSDSKNTLNKNDQEFKNKYIIKYAQLSSHLESNLNNINYILSNKKNYFNENFNKILNIIKTQTNLFFYDNNNIYDKNCKINYNEILNSNIVDTSPSQISNPEYSNTNIYNSNDYESEKSGYHRDLLSAKTSDTNNNIKIDRTNSRNKNINLILSNNDSKNSILSNRNNNINSLARETKNFINVFYDLGFYSDKIISFLFEELIENKEKTNKLNSQINISENKINEKEKKIEELSKLINKKEENKLIKELRNEEKLGKMKKTFKEKINSYIVLTYKLEEEIKSLTKLLDHNQKYVNKYKILEKEIEKNKKMNDELQSFYGKELHERDMISVIQKFNEDELLADINKKDNTINELNKEKTAFKMNEINNYAKITNLKNIIDEKNENILMLNEEFEWSFREMKILQQKNARLQKDLEYLEKKVILFEENERMREIIKKRENQSKEIKKDDKE